MRADDAEPTRADAELANRYTSVTDCTGRTLVVDVENEDAWVRSDRTVDVEEWA